MDARDGLRGVGTYEKSGNQLGLLTGGNFRYFGRRVRGLHSGSLSELGKALLDAFEQARQKGAAPHPLYESP